MERVNVVVVASLAAAVLLVVLRLFSPSDLSPAERSAEPYRSRVTDDEQLPPGVKGWSGRHETRAEQPGSEVPPADEKGGGGDHSNRRHVARGAADLIPGSSGTRRSAEARGGRGPTYTGVLPSSVSDSMVGSRVGAVPPARSLSEGHSVGHDDPTNGRHVFEFVDDAPPEPPPQDGAPEVLFKLPLKGDVKPEVGSGAIQADGLVSQGGEIIFPDDAQLSVDVGDNVRGDAGSISFEFRPQWAGSDETNNSLLAIRDENVWENSLSIVKNFDALRFIIHDSQGVERNVNIPIGDWPAGESRQLTATWDGSSMSLYVDGHLVGQAPLDNPLIFKPSTPMHIGSDYPGSPYVSAGGAMQNFTVYPHALTADEVAKG